MTLTPEQHRRRAEEIFAHLEHRDALNRPEWVLCDLCEDFVEEESA